MSTRSAHFQRIAFITATLALVPAGAGAQRASSSSELRVYLDERFEVPMAKQTAPSWACDPPIPTQNGWLLGNNRPDFQATNANCVEVAGGALRCSSMNNSGAGGYLAYYHPIPALPSSWRLTLRMKNDLETPLRPCPEVLVNVGPTSGPCMLFTNDDPRGKLGFQRFDGGTELVLRDGNMAAYPILTGYDLPGDGSYHRIELISTPAGSEFRAWPDGGQRPALPLATGQSLGLARRVLFGGPNLTNFDYSVDSVRLEDYSVAPLVAVDETLILASGFNFPSSTFVAPQWACDAPLPAFGGWLLANSRPDFQSTNTNNAQAAGGFLRCWSTDNSASGGYLAFFHPVAQPPSTWRLLMRLKVDFAAADRPVPNVFTNIAPTPSEPCSLFPDDDPIGSLGFGTTTGQFLRLYDGASNPTSNTYAIPADGSLHMVELISTPSGSELRAWPSGGGRPALPLVSGASLGRANRVLFGGPNFRNFDYSVDFVRLFARY